MEGLGIFYFYLPGVSMQAALNKFLLIVFWKTGAPSADGEANAERRLWMLPLLLSP